MKPMNLELTIEELSLPGLPAGYQEYVSAAVKRELTRLWQEQGAPDGVVGNSVALPGVTTDVAPNATPDAIGVQVAQSIYANLADGGRSMP